MIIFYVGTVILFTVESLHLFQNKTQYKDYFSSWPVFTVLIINMLLQFDFWFHSKLVFHHLKENNISAPIKIVSTPLLPKWIY